MAQPQLIIIGGGLAGLSAGIFARLSGLETLILEHAARPGGVAATWRRKGYTIDGGIHFHMGVAEGPANRLYRQLGAWQENRFQPLETYISYSLPGRAERLKVTPDLDRLARDLAALDPGLSPAGQKLIKRLIKAAKGLAGSELAEAIPPPPELSGPLTGLKQLLSLGAKARFYGGYYNRAVGELAAEADSPDLAAVLNRLFMPQVPIWFSALVLGLVSRRRLFLCTEGSEGFVRALEARYKDLGGQIQYRTRVTKILVEGDRARGVGTEKGEKFPAEAVISAADSHSTIYDLLGGRYMDDRLAGRFEDLELFQPFLMFNCGTGLDLAQENWSVEKRLTAPLAGELAPQPWLSVRVFNYGSGFAPPGRTLVQVLAWTDWDRWAELKQDPAAYVQAKEQVSKAILGALDDLWPGLARDVDMTDLATPQTIWRYTLNLRGAWEGFVPSPAALRRNLRRTLPGLKNLSLAGQWVMPGGGVIPSLISGRQAVELTCRFLNRPFTGE